MVWTLLALALAADPVEVVRSGSARDRVVVDDADLVIFYASEHRGDLGTCGCDANPRGGLARLGGYLGTVERHGPGTPSVLVHAGWWASDRIGDTVELRVDAVVQNEAFLAGAGLLGFDALNLTFRDSAWIREHPVPTTALSANAGLDLPRFQRLDAGGTEVVVTGVSRPGSQALQPEGASWSDPVAAVEAVIDEVGGEPLLVVLAFDVGADTEAIARLPGVDVVIEAGEIAGKLEPWSEGAVWVQSRDLGQALGELRLWLDDGGVARFRDRWVDLDLELPEDRVLRKLQRRTERERLAVLREAGLAP